MLEHDRCFWKSIPEMARVLAPGGRLLLTTRGIGFPVHRHPSDYWRFTPEAVEALLTDAGLNVLESVEDDPYWPGVLALATKPV